MQSLLIVEPGHLGSFVGAFDIRVLFGQCADGISQFPSYHVVAGQVIGYLFEALRYQFVITPLSVVEHGKVKDLGIKPGNQMIGGQGG